MSRIAVLVFFLIKQSIKKISLLSKFVHLPQGCLGKEEKL